MKACAMAKPAAAPMAPAPRTIIVLIVWTGFGITVGFKYPEFKRQQVLFYHKNR